MNRKTNEKGQALILIALAAIGLFAFSALAIDGSRAYSDKRQAQNAADTAVLSAALKYIREPNAANKFTAAETAARQIALANGFSDDGNTIVDIDLCDNVVDASDKSGGNPLPFKGDNIACEGVASGKGAEYIRVRILKKTPTTFGRVVGRQMVESAVEAIAHVTGGSSSTSSWPFTGAGMVSTKSGNTPQCLMLNGGGDLYVHGAGIEVNCTHTQAWQMDGNSTLRMDANGKVAGCYFQNGSSNWNKDDDPIDCWQTPKAYSANDFKNVPTTLPVPSCNKDGSFTGGTTQTSYNGTIPNVNVKSGTTVFEPGRYDKIEVSPGATAKFKAGTYCINNGLDIKEKLSNNTAGDKVQLVLGNSSITVNSGAAVDFDNLELYFTNGSYQQNSDKVSFNADRLRVFTTGSGTVDVNAGGTFTSDNAYIYLNSGNIVWNSNMTLRLKASTEAGDPFAGLLIYKPWGNNQQVTFNGGSNVYLQGTFLAPSSPAQYNGNTTFNLHSQIIASTFRVDGGADVDIYYVASENYGSVPAATPLIELSK